MAGRRKFGRGYARHRPGAQSFTQLDYSREAYKGYLIRVNQLTGEMWIEKDGQLIHRVPASKSWEYARGEIDKLTATNPRKRGKLHGAAKRAFLARMAKGRKRKAGHRRANPAKLERCVRKVKRTRKVRNAYAVCTASFGRKKRVRRRNAKGYSMRSGHYLVAVRGKTRLYYDGQHFSHKGSARLYPSRSAAASVGRGLVRHYPVLRAYRLYVGHT